MARLCRTTPWPNAGEKPGNAAVRHIPAYGIIHIGRAVSLEFAQVEFALGTRDIVADGFEVALLKAAKLVSGEVIFNIRAPGIATSSASRPFPSQTVLVLPAKDGTTMTVASDQAETTLREWLRPDFTTVIRELRS